MALAVPVPIYPSGLPLWGLNLLFRVFAVQAVCRASGYWPGGGGVRSARIDKRNGSIDVLDDLDDGTPFVVRFTGGFHCRG